MNDSGWLVLWDIDGTLLIGASEVHARAMWRTIQDVHGIEHRMTTTSGRAGMTDGQISREILIDAGVEATQIDERASTVIERVSSVYDPGDLQETVNPGIPAVLAEIAARGDVAQSLVTGNFEQIARRKLTAAGIVEWFDPALRGGFGSDHEAREYLPAIARERAGRVLRSAGDPWPVERTVIVGDTPRDVACARYDGVHVIGITTGPHSASELAGADVVVSDAASLRDALWTIFDSSLNQEGAAS